MSRRSIFTIAVLVTVAVGPAMLAAAQYRDLKKEDGIQFHVHGMTFGFPPSALKLSADGNIHPTGHPFGTLDEFGLVDSTGTFIKLKLIDHKYADGHIKTRMFGDIIVSMCTTQLETHTSLYCSPDVGVSYAATEDQIKKIHEFLSAQAKKSAPPSK